MGTRNFLPRVPDDDDYNNDDEDDSNGIDGVDDDGVIGVLVRVGRILGTFCLECLGSWWVITDESSQMMMSRWHPYL